MLWWGQYYCCLVNIFIKSSGQLECCDGNRIITSEISDVRDEMINFYSSDCDENQSEISDSSDFIVFPNIKWSSSQELSLADFYFGLTLGINYTTATTGLVKSFKYGAAFHVVEAEDNVYLYIRNIHSSHPHRNHMRSLTNEIMA